MKTTSSPANGSNRDLVLRKAASGVSQYVYLEPADSAQTHNPEPSGLYEYWLLLFSRKWLIAALTVFGAVAALIVNSIISPLYLARTTMEIQGVPSRDAATGTADAEGEFSPEVYLHTQARVLQSRTLQVRALKRLPALTPKRTYRQPAPLTLSMLFRNSRPLVAATTLPPVKTTVRIPENSRIIEIMCDSPDPVLSADFANTIAQEYIDFTIEAQWDTAQRNTEWLNRQVDQTRKNLQASENALQAYSSQYGLLYTGDQRSLEEERLRQLQEELSRASADRMSKQALGHVASKTTADALAQVQDDARLMGYKTKLAELRWSLADLAVLYEPAHYRVERVHAQIRELEKTLEQERQNVLTRINNDQQAASQRERLLNEAYIAQSQKVNVQAQRAIMYGILKRDVDTNRQIYEQLLQRTKQATVSSALGRSSARVLDPAEVPLNPYRPSLPRNLLLGLFAGALLGVAWVMAGEQINRSLRAPGEAEFHLHVPELGVIPFRQSVHARSPLPPAERLLLRRHGDSNDAAVELATWRDRPSELAESFRNVIASILAGGVGAQWKVMLVTSATRGEGKSTVVANLGIALAEINYKVVMVDADMRKPRLHEVFNLPNSWGLTDLLKEKTSLRLAPLEALVRATSVENAFLLPAGPGAVSIAALLYSQRLRELVDRLRQDFDIVLIDSPPISALSDARFLGRMADAAILVIRASRTTRDAALAAKERLVNDGIVVAGTVLNGWDMKSKTRYGYSYGYGDYAHSYDTDTDQ